MCTDAHSPTSALANGKQRWSLRLRCRNSSLNKQQFTCWFSGSRLGATGQSQPFSRFQCVKAQLFQHNRPKDLLHVSCSWPYSWSCFSQTIPPLTTSISYRRH